MLWNKLQNRSVQPHGKTYVVKEKRLANAFYKMQMWTTSDNSPIVKNHESILPQHVTLLSNVS